MNELPDLPDDYLPLVVSVVPGVDATGPAVLPPVTWSPGRDIELHLSPFLRLRPGHAGIKLAGLVLAYCRQARTIYVRSGEPTVRENLAWLLATALGSSDTLVLWEDPTRPTAGPQLAPYLRLRHSVLAARDYDSAPEPT